MSDFFKNIVKDLNDVNTNIADEELNSSEFTGTIDTGSYVLNALLSGSIYGGAPNNKIIGLAGEPAAGKTFFALGIAKQFLDLNPSAAVFYFDTEASVTKSMISSRGIDPKRIIISEPDTIQKFRTTAIAILDKYMLIPEKDRPPMMMVLDSQGQLSSAKEMEDTTSGSDTRDMTKGQLMKGVFRVLTLKLSKAKVPMFVTAHVYDQMGSMYPSKEVSGGRGMKYSASQILMLSKRKDKDGTEVVGNIIHCKLEKSRFTKENKVVDVKLSYSKGLDRYYGLVELAEKYGIFKKVSTRYELPDGRKVFGKSINENPTEYYTKEILDLIDAGAKKEFLYGSDDEEEIINVD